jgi:CRP-like cAMP-binding protein
MKRTTYREIIQADADATLAWDLIRDQMVLQHIERERDLLTETAQERSDRVLRRSPRLFQEVPAKYIANYLRMSPETLSRLLRS